ncbi:unnamed protein product, partial [Didymodactylos carnosus]
KLFEEIYKAGVVDSFGQPLALVYMALNQADVSKILTGPLHSYSIQYLRHLKQFFQIMFKIDDSKKVKLKSLNDTEQMDVDDNDADEQLKTGSEKLILTVVGLGYTNLTKTLI